MYFIQKIFYTNMSECLTWSHFEKHSQEVGTFSAHFLGVGGLGFDIVFL